MLKYTSKTTLLILLITQSNHVQSRTFQIHEQRLKKVEEAHKEHLSTQSDADKTCKILAHHEWFCEWFKENRSLIIIGPDRSQKRLYAKTLARELNRTWVIITSQILLGATKGQTMENVEKLFNYIINHDKSPILIIDNIDGLIDYSKEHADHSSFENSFKQIVEKYKKEKNLTLIAISSEINHIADVKSFAGSALFTRE